MNKPTYEELAAQVDVLKYHINRVIQASACNTGNEPSLSCFHRALDEAHDVFRATPAACLLQVTLPQNADDAAAMAIIGINWLQEHAPKRFADYMRQVKAEAGRAGFIAGADAVETIQMLASDESIESMADQYAERIKQGDKP
jgi:hypothetical protein